MMDIEKGEEERKGKRGRGGIWRESRINKNRKL